MILENNQIEDISIEVIQQLTTEQAWHYKAVPFQSKEDSIYIFVKQEVDYQSTKEELEILLGKEIITEPIEENHLLKLLAHHYRKEEVARQFHVDVAISPNHNQHFLEDIITDAKVLGSSDIHIEPYEKKCRIRYRIDGMLVERCILNIEDHPALSNKIKIKAQMDIAERRLPQDGRIFFETDGQKFDIRVSTMPTLHGEKIVMRLLNTGDTSIDINALGFNPAELKDYLEGVKRPNGIVLISGPTGSGKTTTLYATLQELNDQTRNILTIEDPIEYTLEGINQVQLKESIGLNFASALRTFLRQDPDVIMLGEIRDVETASMAIRASLTGHLILSTIHTNSAWGIIARLIDMGIPPYLLADTINTAVAQRLVRLLCSSCKQPVNYEEGILPRNYKAPMTISKHYKAVGCSACHFTGYKGRKGIYEIIPLDEELRENIRNGVVNVRQLLKQKDIFSLAENAFRLFINGETSIKEIYPILASTT